MILFRFGMNSFRSGMNSYRSGIYSFRCNFSHSVMLVLVLDRGCIIICSWSIKVTYRLSKKMNFWVYGSINLISFSPPRLKDRYLLTICDCIISWSAAGHRPAVQGVPRDRGRLHGLVHPGVRGEVRLQSQQGDAECGHDGHKYTLMFRSSLFPKSWTW